VILQVVTDFSPSRGQTLLALGEGPTPFGVVLELRVSLSMVDAGAPLQASRASEVRSSA